MTLRNDLLLFAAGLVAASVNAAAGGGTLLSFPSLMAAGLSPLAANATSTVGLLTGYFASVAGYRRDLEVAREDAGRAVPPSVVGGAFGAWLLIALGGAFFKKVVPWLLIGAALLLFAQPLLARLLRKRPEHSRPGVILVANFLCAIYAGYFGAGVGILFLAAMGLLYAHDIGKVNAIKTVVALVANVIAAITFAVLELRHPTGALVWRAAAPLALGAALGGFVGVRVARRLSPQVLRGFAASVGVAIALYLVFRR